jgi:hypothetical protein
MMAKVRVKYLQPHGDNAHCTYGVLTSAAADKLEAKGIVQVRGPVPNDYVEPASSDAALGQEG